MSGIDSLRKTMTDATQPFGIVDIFAGPGGLSEGFASVRNEDGSRPFKIALSIEKDPIAYRTLRLRSLVHELDQDERHQYINILNQFYSTEIEDRTRETFPEKWETACQIAQCLELSDQTKTQTEDLLDLVREKYQHTGLIGGPPCQVYSLVGRSRNSRNNNYKGDEDHRHTLYKQYIHVLAYLQPDFFVMENVKGMLSSKHQSELIFPLVRDDLEKAGDGYTLFALSPDGSGLPLFNSRKILNHTDYIVKMEQFGVPQKRHRIIIVGIRSALMEGDIDCVSEILRLVPKSSHTVNEALSGLPKLRSGISRSEDFSRNWQDIIKYGLALLRNENLDTKVLDVLQEVAHQLDNNQLPTERYLDSFTKSPITLPTTVEGLYRLHHHETRAHIETDIIRYLFASAYSEAHNRSPRASEYPKCLAPNHANWNSGNFNDRFRVQVGNDASSTVMSHISKDGHYYIHPDPTQARSLTVREAARLQTFPDDYIFLGNRTQQYHQVGNAVPPALASQIANLLNRFMNTTICRNTGPHHMR